MGYTPVFVPMYYGGGGNIVFSSLISEQICGIGVLILILGFILAIVGFGISEFVSNKYERLYLSGIVAIVAGVIILLIGVMIEVIMELMS